MRKSDAIIFTLLYFIYGMLSTAFLTAIAIIAIIKFTVPGAVGISFTYWIALCVTLFFGSLFGFFNAGRIYGKYLSKGE